MLAAHLLIKYKLHVMAVCIVADLIVFPPIVHSHAPLPPALLYNKGFVCTGYVSLVALCSPSSPM